MHPHTHCYSHCAPPTKPTQSVGDLQGAVKVHLAAGKFDAARALAAGDAALMAYVQQEHTNMLVKQKNAIELAAIGQSDQVMMIMI